MLNRPLIRPLAGRPLAGLALALMGGIFLAARLAPSPSSALVAAGSATALALVCCIITRFRRWQPLLLSAAALGFFLCAMQCAALAAFPLAEGERAVICGLVRGVAVELDDGRYRLRLRVETIDGAAVDCADIYVYAEGDPPRAGSRIAATGERYLARAYGNSRSFDYNSYLQTQGIAAQFSTYFNGGVTVLREGGVWRPANLTARLRDCFDQAASQLSDKQRTLIYGVFLGNKGDLDYGLSNALSLSGMMHAFSVSGLHVGYIVLLAVFLAGRGFRRRRQRFLLTLALLLVYLGLTGLLAPVVRATVMALVLLLADLLMEQGDGLTTLSFAALICLLVQPLWLFDAGFQLSFAAMWGMIELTPVFLGLLGGVRGRITDMLAASLAATLATLPLICYYFYQITWLGWLISPLALPLVGAAVLLCFVALPLAVAWPLLAEIVLYVAARIMELLSYLAGLAADWPLFASVTGAPPTWLVVAFYAALLFIPAVYRRLRRWATVPLLLLIAAFYALSGAAHTVPQGMEAEITFIDVGQGDAALITTADGMAVLIDGGGRAWAPGDIGQYVLLPYLKSRGITDIDLIISSHPDLDHADGLLSVLAYLDVETLMYADAFAGNELQERLLAAARDHGCRLVATEAGCSYRLGAYLQIAVYSPADSAFYADENDASLVVEISCGAIDVLFTGDAPGGALADICRQYEVEAELVKLPHHGSKTGYDEDFYRALEAQVAIISVGAENSYGHPAAKVVEYWQENAAVYRTDTDGAVTVTTDGAAYAITTEK